MSWVSIATWLNRLGMTLEFISFWFAAPELLGVERLKDIENRLKSKLEIIINYDKDHDLVLIGVFSSLAIAGIIMVLAFNFGMPLLVERFNLTNWILIPVLMVFALLVGIVGALIVWVMFGLLVFVPLFFFDNFIPWVLKTIESDASITRRWIIIGGSLLIIGFLLQFISTF